MKTILRTLRQDLQRAVDALAMAHHGEMLCRSTKYRIISGCNPWKTSSSGSPSNNASGLSDETIAKTTQRESFTLEAVPTTNTRDSAGSGD